MSIAICRVEKVKGASGVAGLQIHNRRERANSNSNPDIDHSRSHLNYALIETLGKTFNVLADERIKKAYTGTKAIRKDAVRVVTSIFTSDYAFFENKPIEEQRKFFDDCLKWTQERFGAENIISAIVHMDEETPHLHIEFVPLTADGRLTAKSVVGGRVDLQQMQDDFYKSVGEVWGMERGERADLDNPEDKPRKHKSTAQLKSETEAVVAVLIAERAKLAAENAERQKTVKALQGQEKALQSSLGDINRQIKALEKKESDLKNKLSESESKIKSLAEEYKIKKNKIDEIKNYKIKNGYGLNAGNIIIEKVALKEVEEMRKLAISSVAHDKPEKTTPKASQSSSEGIKQVNPTKSTEKNRQPEKASLLNKLEQNQKKVDEEKAKTKNQEKKNKKSMDER